MNDSVSLAITSIAGADHPVLKMYARECATKKIYFVVAGDTKSPKDFSLEHCDFLSIDTQKNDLSFRIASLIPDKHYAKKNIAYLQAIQKGCNIIIETDDDNIPLDSFWENRQSHLNGHLLENTGWTNIYRYFSDVNIWPRGFSLKHLAQPLPELKNVKVEAHYCPVQQGLADENPDVDAIYRLILPLPIYFNSHETVILGQNAICPFNSQNTTWFKEAFALLYLPAYCSFRMTDIWRSFIAQRILWTCGWNLAFHKSTVYQQRNEHSLMKDFEDEVCGYVGNEEIMAVLMGLQLKAGKEYIFENLKSCYVKLVDKKFIGEQELPLVDAWIEDMKKLA